MDVSHADIRVGIPLRTSTEFAFDQTVTCDYVDKELNGASAKFSCAITPDDVVKVKYGRDNGEVFAEVAATRLLWALGFGADHMYPVRVICHGCSKDPHSERGWHEGVVTFAYAAIERKLPGKELDTPGLIGWKWPELELVSQEAGGATRAERDALKLLAVVIQHTDSKAGAAAPRLRRQERAKGEDPAACEHPFMMINDLGITFGRANLLNRRVPGSVDLDAWSSTPVFTHDAACVGNISKSFFWNPGIPADQRGGPWQLLSDLLMQLTDQQLHDLFDVARFPDRTWKGKSVSGTVDQWVAAFKAKREEIAARSCGG